MFYLSTVDDIIPSPLLFLRLAEAETNTLEFLKLLVFLNANALLKRVTATRTTSIVKICIIVKVNSIIAINRSNRMIIRAP